MHVNVSYPNVRVCVRALSQWCACVRGSVSICVPTLLCEQLCVNLRAHACLLHAALRVLLQRRSI